MNETTYDRCIELISKAATRALTREELMSSKRSSKCFPEELAGALESLLSADKMQIAEEQWTMLADQVKVQIPDSLITEQKIQAPFSFVEFNRNSATFFINGLALETLDHRVVFNQLQENSKGLNKKKQNALSNFVLSALLGPDDSEKMVEIRAVWKLISSLSGWSDSLQSDFMLLLALSADGDLKVRGGDVLIITGGVTGDPSGQSIFQVCDSHGNLKNLYTIRVARVDGGGAHK